MFIKKLVSYISKLIPKDIKNTGNMVRETLSHGWQRGKRLAGINKKGKIGSIFTKAVSAKRELKTLKFTRQDIPALSAVLLTTTVPVPGAMMTGYITGHGIKQAVNLISKCKKSVFA